MTKHDLIRNVAFNTGETQTRVEKIYDEIFKTIAEALAKEDRVHIPTFGVFNVKWRKEKVGRNPRTGEPVLIPPKRVVKFTPAKALQEKINQKED